MFPPRTPLRGSQKIARTREPECTTERKVQGAKCGTVCELPRDSHGGLSSAFHVPGRTNLKPETPYSPNSSATQPNASSSSLARVGRPRSSQPAIW